MSNITKSLLKDIENAKTHRDLQYIRDQYDLTMTVESNDDCRKAVDYLHIDGYTVIGRLDEQIFYDAVNDQGIPISAHDSICDIGYIVMDDRYACVYLSLGRADESWNYFRVHKPEIRINLILDDMKEIHLDH